MRQNGFLDQTVMPGTIGDVIRSLPSKEVITIEDDKSLDYAVRIFKAHGISQLPCVADGRLSGIVTESDLLHFLVEGKDVTTPLAEVMVRRVHTVHLYDEVGVLPQLFERGEVAIVIDDDRQVTGVLTKLDYIEFISQRAKLGTAVQGSAAAGS
jgi:cystathionine beta-synthase